MSYLNPLRLHFAGRFQANVSTVNNDPGHFDNATFLPSYQKMQDRQNMNGWFNPQGDAAFRLIGVAVTAAWTPGGAAASDDPVLGYRIADSDNRVCAKLADLDSEQQLVSQIWGLEVRIADAQGHTLLRGDYEPAAFMDIWDRSGSGGGDVGAGAMYQSVLRNLQWGDVSSSPFLVALKAAASEGLLSIKFNVDGFNLDFRSPDFMTGRLVGTIGPASAGEPAHLVIGRQFLAAAAEGGNFFTPAGGVNFFAGLVDEGAGVIFLDLGNALTTTSPGGPPTDLGDLTLGATPGNPGGSLVALCVIPSQGNGGYASDPQWYARTAGVVVLPLTAAQLTLVSNAPLTLYSAGNPNVSIAEWSSGAFLRADSYVFRLSPGDEVQIPVYASQWGRPMSGAAVNFVLDPSQLQPSNSIDPNDVPPVATPASALSFNPGAVTDARGVAVLTLKTGDPGTPRYFNNGQNYGLDGQVYGIRPTFADPAFSGPVNQWNFISLLLWSGFAPADPLTWDQLQPVFQQYANLYPVMNRFLDMGDFHQVAQDAGFLSLAFGLDPADPNAMPATRDLSPAKRRAILSWLKNPLPGKTGEVARIKPAPAPELALAAAAPPAAPPKGGKAEAAARRLVLR